MHSVKQLNLKKLWTKLGDLNYDDILNVEEEDIVAKLNPVYELIKETSKDDILSNKDLIGLLEQHGLFFYIC